MNIKRIARLSITPVWGYKKLSPQDQATYKTMMKWSMIANVVFYGGQAIAYAYLNYSASKLASTETMVVSFRGDDGPNYQADEPESQMLTVVTMPVRDGETMFTGQEGGL